jgi:hypothetical protein
MADTFKEDYYAAQWMEWRSNIETGDILTNVAAIPDVERELAAKYKALLGHAHRGRDLYVRYAVAIVLGRHYEYVRAIWRTLVCTRVRKESGERRK